MTTQKVYGAIAAVMSDLSKEGIGKNRKNEQQRYTFRGIDDVYNELAPILAKHKLCMLPRILSREVIERQSQRGGVLFYVTVEAEFDLICAEDGSKHTVRTYGEAMDSADKATNKAMSAAYKYAAVQAFCIPTEGDNDADAQTPDVAPKGHQARPQQQRPPADDNPFDGETNVETDRRMANQLRSKITTTRSLDELDRVKRSADFAATYRSLPDELQKEIAGLGAEHREFIAALPENARSDA